MVNEIHDLLDDDPTLKAMEGIKIDKYVDESTLRHGGQSPYKRHIVISLDSSGREEWNYGGLACQKPVNVKIQTLCRLRDDEYSNVREMAENLRSRIAELLFDADLSTDDDSNATGWLWHQIVTDSNIDAPTKEISYHTFIVECWISIWT